VFLQVTFGVLIVVLVGKIQFDRAIHHHQSPELLIPTTLGSDV
jgi:hypothetical protein